MKKIVILGGGANQLPLIEESKELGYNIVLCDFRDNVPGIQLADIHYQVDTLNYEQILTVCKKEKPDGIVTNSEPAMPTMTKVANALGLISNSYSSIVTLMSKPKFRKLQHSLGLYSPKCIETSDINELTANITDLKFPIIIKPSECSGTRGTKRIDINCKELIESTFNNCKQFSRNNKVTIEEFVEMPSLTTIEGEIFVHNKEILWDGIFSTTRSKFMPMLPMTYTLPSVLDEERLNKVKKAIEKIFKALNIVCGEFNIEGYFNKNDDFFIIEINARQGGNGLPVFVEHSIGINYNKLLVSTSVGDESYWSEITDKKNEKSKFVTRHAVNSPKEATYQGLNIEECLSSYVKDIYYYKAIGEKLNNSGDATSLVAIVDLEFDCREKQLEYYDKLDTLIQVI